MSPFAVRLAAFGCGVAGFALHAGRANPWVLAGLGLLLIILFLTLRRRRAVTLTLHAGGFAIPADPILPSIYAIMLLTAAAGATVPAGIFLIAAAIALLVIQRPRLRLTPEGLISERLLRTYSVAWHRIAPGAPMNYLTFSLPLSDGSSFTLPLTRLAADPLALLGLIRHYLGDPPARSEIGTPAELTRAMSAVPRR